ncbi:type II secretion system protein GspG [Ferruginibacter sp. SUN002]|uniref:type II secretion system protein GspG n=1 Tax=Ferruginibacter sp. SUN002 TaxID=2937789 RepID=UPI003D35B889
MGNVNQVNIKPPYSKGWFCLIPLVGAFVGISLILNGLFKYKSRKLVVIGSAGVLFTVFVYSMVFYSVKYGNPKGVAEISQTYLNSVVKDVEFYKLQNGTYPDILEQLVVNNKLAYICDPLLTRKMDNSIKTTFEYKKIDNKYTLFSVGIDGISHTPDDIYPVIVMPDTVKFGLIRSN